MIDAHQHIWRLGENGCVWPTADDGVLHRDWSLDDFRAEALPRGVRRTVLVQSQESDRDTEWLLALAEGEALVAAVVGWADLAAVDAPARIAALAAQPKLAGLRPMVQHRPADCYGDPAIEAGLRALVDHGLVLDALIRVPHLHALGRLADRLPELRIVIDHAAKPAVGSVQGFADWYPGIAWLAERANVTCKLSGLLTECGEARAEAIEPYIATILDLFGAERVMWGSDWPVLNAASDYGVWLDLALRLVPREDHDFVFGGTASRVYNISEKVAA
jgi:L-fuconolactonase